MPRLRASFPLGLALGAVAFSAEAQILCLPIDVINLQGVTLLSSETQDRLLLGYTGRCLGVAEFDEILQDVTMAYVDRGFVLARAYLPEQDLSDGSLDVAILEGSLAAIHVNGAREDRWMGMVFPGQVGKPVQLRNTEQGVDQIQSMPRWQAHVEYDAGDAPGETIMLVDAQTSKPFELRFTTNNRGDEATGRWVSGLSGDATQIFGLNDTVRFGLTHTLSPGPLSFEYAGDRNRSAHVGFAVPYGRWNFDFERRWSDYSLEVPGAVSPILTEGWTRGWTAQSKFLLDRDQDSLTHLRFDLSASQSANYIQGVLIESSSRKLSSLRATLSHEHRWDQARIDGAIWVEQGLFAFGAQDGRLSPPGSPDPQYTRVGLDAHYERFLSLEGGSLRLDATMAAQLSGDRLFGGQQFSIGGASTVRGTRIALARGSSGIFLRNEATYTPNGPPLPVFGQASLYAGLDWGAVAAQPDLNVAGGAALGSAVGLRTQAPHVTFDLSWQQVLGVSPGLQKPAGEAFAQIEFRF